MKKKVILIGGFKEIIESFETIGINNVYIVDPHNYMDCENYLGDDKSFINKINNYSSDSFCITPDQPNIRERIYKIYKKYGLNYPVFEFKNANISPSANVNKGAIIAQGSFVSSGASIGKFVKLNVNSCIMHDSIINEFTSCAPSCTVLGRAHIGKGCYIGASATVLPNVKICDNVVIGAGSVVTRDINSPGVYAGVPAKPLSLK